MKKTNMTLICALLAFSGTSSAGWADLLNQAADTADQVQNGSATMNTINNSVQNTPALKQTTQTGLVNALVSQLGVTPEQAQGGSGALFQVAKSEMSAADFSQVSQSVPGMDGLLASVPQDKPQSETASLLGGLAAASGNSTLVNAASLVDTFQQLNLSEGMVSQFTPIIVDYVKQNGGEMTANLLKAVLTSP